MNNLFLRILPVIIAVIITGCNNDIFIDDDHPSIPEIEIPDQGEKSITFQTSQLQSIEIAFLSGSYDCTLFGPSGEVYNTYDNRDYIYMYETSSSMPAITRLLAESDDVVLEITRSRENELTVTSIRNTTGYSIHGRIMLSYTYKEEYVSFTILPSPDGPPSYSIRELTYNTATLSQEFSGEYSTPLKIINHTSTVTKQVFNPDQYCHTFVLFNVDGLSSLTLDPDCEMPVVEIPSYVHKPGNDEITGGFNGRELRFSLEVISSPTPDNALINGGSFNVDYPVEVAPMSAMQGHLSIERIILKAEALLTLVNRRNEKELKLPVNVTVIQPYDYTFEWKEVPVED